MVATQARKGTKLKYTVFRTSMGWVGAIASPSGIRRLNLPVPTHQQALEELGLDDLDAEFEPEYFAKLGHAVQMYLDGKVKQLMAPLDLEGAPPFFLAVWRACLTIPPGEKRSYAWLAEQAGNPRAVRAAGQAMARNPIALIIPCHRVVGSSGDLTGYGGGLDMKAKLLAQEAR